MTRRRRRRRGFMEGGNEFSSFPHAPTQTQPSPAADTSLLATPNQAPETRRYCRSSVPTVASISGSPSDRFSPRRRRRRRSLVTLQEGDTG